VGLQARFAGKRKLLLWFRLKKVFEAGADPIARQRAMVVNRAAVAKIRKVEYPASHEAVDQAQRVRRWWKNIRGGPNGPISQRFKRI